ncbi:MAG TPA: serine/threonine-protein kinase [Polyangia bacterium]|jgi:serine/threonine-protein kinase
MGGQGEGGPPWPLAAGTVLGKYQILRLVGEGGMGTVYEALHLEIGKRVAIKTMSPALAAVPAARARFVREARLTSRVRHPHIVDVTDIGTDDDAHPFLVMELLEGEDLARHIQRRGPLPIEEVADVALPLLAAIGAAHDEGIVHRDLKPQNIFLAELRDGTIRPTVLDFGISKAPPQVAADPITTTGGLLGSPSYFAPEQVNDPKSVDTASDQYALGVILYECVAGRLPYAGSSLASIFDAILRGRYLPAQTHRPDLPDGFQAVIARAMSIDPGARFPGLRPMGRALLPFASERARLVWASHFAESETINEALARRARAGVPATDQMPAPAVPALATTVGLGAAGRRVAGRSDPGPLAPAAAVAAPPSVPSLAIPRHSRAAWVLSGVALAAVGLVAGMAIHGRGAPPLPPRPAIGSGPVTAAAATVPSPVAATATAPAPVAPPASQGDVKNDDGKRTAAAPRHGRPARGPRFGPNRAPLIE